MSSLARKMRRNKAKKNYKDNKNISDDMYFSNYWKIKEGKPVDPNKNKKNKKVYEPPKPGTESKLIPQELEKEQEREKKRQESIETGKSFLKGLDIFNKKVEDIKAHDEHGEHD